MGNNVMTLPSYSVGTPWISNDTFLKDKLSSSHLCMCESHMGIEFQSSGFK